MAPSRNRVVTRVGAGAGDGDGNGNGAGVGGLAIGTGYESPSEDNVPSFLEPPPPPSPGVAVPPLSVSPPVAPRPLLVQRSSYVAVAVTTSRPSPDNGLHGHGHGVSRASSLNRVIADVEKTPGSRKVGIRDRIACHQWTYFTMVNLPWSRPRLPAELSLRPCPQEASPTSCIAVSAPASCTRIPPSLLPSCRLTVVASLQSSGTRLGSEASASSSSCLTLSSLSPTASSSSCAFVSVLALSYALLLIRSSRFSSLRLYVLLSLSHGYALISHSSYRKSHVHHS